MSIFYPDYHSGDITEYDGCNLVINNLVQTFNVFPSLVLGLYVAPYIVWKQLLSYKGLLKLFVLLMLLFLLTL